jgi:hypothetical protein
VSTTLLEKKSRPSLFTQFGEEPFSFDLADEICGLAKEHGDEVNPIRGMDIDVDKTLYMLNAREGRLFIFTARLCASRELVGYSIYIVGTDAHFRKSLRATNDIFYLKPEVRKGWLGYNFLKFCEEKLKQKKVDMIYQETTLLRDLGSMLKRAGYQPVQMSYAKRLI